MFKVAVASFALLGGALFAVPCFQAESVGSDEPVVENQKPPEESPRGCPCDKGKGKK